MIVMKVCNFKNILDYSVHWTHNLWFLRYKWNIFPIPLIYSSDGVRYFAPWEKCNTFCIPFYDSYNSVQFMKYSRLFTLGTQFVLEAKILRKIFLENKGGFWAFEMLKDKVHDHTEKWLFSGAIIWQNRTQIPELVFFCFHHHLVL